MPPRKLFGRKSSSDELLTKTNNTNHYTQHSPRKSSKQSNGTQCEFRESRLDPRDSGYDDRFKVLYPIDKMYGTTESSSNTSTSSRASSKSNASTSATSQSIGQSPALSTSSKYGISLAPPKRAHLGSQSYHSSPITISSASPQSLQSTGTSSTYFTAISGNSVVNRNFVGRTNNETGVVNVDDHMNGVGRLKHESLFLAADDHHRQINGDDHHPDHHTFTSLDPTTNKNLHLRRSTGDLDRNTNTAADCPIYNKFTSQPSSYSFLEIDPETAKFIAKMNGYDSDADSIQLSPILPEVLDASGKLTIGGSKQTKGNDYNPNISGNTQLNPTWSSQTDGSRGLENNGGFGYDINSSAEDLKQNVFQVRDNGTSLDINGDNEIPSPGKKKGQKKSSSKVKSLFPSFNFYKPLGNGPETVVPPNEVSKSDVENGTNVSLMSPSGEVTNEGLAKNYDTPYSQPPTITLDPRAQDPLQTGSESDFKSSVVQKSLASPQRAAHIKHRSSKVFSKQLVFPGDQPYHHKESSVSSIEASLPKRNRSNDGKYLSSEEDTSWKLEEDDSLLPLNVLPPQPPAQSSYAYGSTIAAASTNSNQAVPRSRVMTRSQFETYRKSVVMGSDNDEEEERKEKRKSKKRGNKKKQTNLHHNDNDNMSNGQSDDMHKNSKAESDEGSLVEKEDDKDDDSEYSSSSSESGDDESEDEETRKLRNRFDNEDNDKKESIRMRLKQDAHLSVYRQKMTKVTGSQTALSAMARSSTMLDLPPDLAGLDDDEEDEYDDVPLAVLQAHGFPSNNNRRLKTMASQPNLSSSKLAAPGESGPNILYNNNSSSASINHQPIVGTNRMSTIPPLPSDVFGAHSNVAPRGLIGEIAREEEAKARRKSMGGLNLLAQAGGGPGGGRASTYAGSLFNGVGGGVAPGGGNEIQAQLQQLMQIQMTMLQQLQQPGAGPPLPQQQPPMSQVPNQQMRKHMSSFDIGRFSGAPPAMVGGSRPGSIRSFSGSDRSLGSARYRPTSMGARSMMNLSTQPQTQPAYRQSMYGVSQQELSNSKSQSPRMSVNMTRPQSQQFSAMQKPKQQTSSMRLVETTNDENDGEEEEDEDAGWQEMLQKRKQLRETWKQQGASARTGNTGLAAAPGTASTSTAAAAALVS